MYRESQKPDPDTGPESMEKLAAETTSEKESVYEKFRALTGVEPLETTETQRLGEKMCTIAGEFTDIFSSNGLITEQKAQEVKQKWKVAVFLDRDGMYRVMDFMTVPYKKASMDLKNRKEKSPAEIELISKLDRITQNLYNSVDGASAMVYRPQLEQLLLNSRNLPKELIENPGEYLLVNTRSFERSETVDREMRIVALEETCHMLSHLKNYEIHSKWLEETMARIIAVNIPGGHVEVPEELEEVKKFLRYQDYKDLFSCVSTLSEVPEETMIKIFLGTEPSNSENVKKVREAAKKIDLLGELVDQGISLKNLQKIQGNQ